MDEATRRVVVGTPEDVDREASMPGAWLHERQQQSILETLDESVSDTMPWTLFYSRAQMRTKAWAHFPGLTSIFATLDPWNRSSDDVVIIERKSDVDPVSAQTTTLAIVRRDEIGLTFTLVASSSADRLLCQEDISSDVDESASGDGSDGTEDERLFGVGTQHANISTLKKKDEYRVLSRRKDGALSDTGRPLSLRRARGSGYLWKKRDIFDDGTGDDSYWTEQVNARLSGERGPRRASGRYGRSDVSSWDREEREDETDNWHIRSSQVTDFAVPERTSDAVQCQVDSDSTKLRRHSSPPLNVDASLSDRAGRYVVSGVIMISLKMETDDVY